MANIVARGLVAFRPEHGSTVLGPVSKNAANSGRSRQKRPYGLKDKSNDETSSKREGGGGGRTPER